MVAMYVEVTLQLSGMPELRSSTLGVLILNVQLFAVESTAGQLSAIQLVLNGLGEPICSCSICDQHFFKLYVHKHLLSLSSFAVV